MTMTTLEMVFRTMISRVETGLWDEKVADDILSHNGDIIGSTVSGHHRVNNDGYINYVLADSERGVKISPSFSVIIMDGEGFAVFIKFTFRKDDLQMIHELDIESIDINGCIVKKLDEMPLPCEGVRKIENMVMNLCSTQL